MNVGGILICLVVNCAVSFLLAALIRSTMLAIIASIIICEMLFLNYGWSAAADADVYVYDVLLAVNIIAMFGLPVLVGTSAGFVTLARRL
jgi:membrane-anchored protein YejM (alkaline phosphatase superfamily)